MVQIMRTQEEIDKQLELTYEKNYAGMTYAEGVRATIEWLTEKYDHEEDDAAPMD